VKPVAPPIVGKAGASDTAALAPGARERAGRPARPPLAPPFGRGEHIDGRRPWWRYPLPELMAALEASEQGLSELQARARLAYYGPNSVGPAPPHWLRQFGARLTNPLVLLLLFAGAISAASGAAASAAIIAAMVILSVVLDCVQAYRAGQAADRLNRSVAVQALVRRDGALRRVEAQQLVPGDVLELRAGQLIPADGRVLAARDLFVRQAALTGESYPVEKVAAGLPANDQLVEATNALFRGTSVVSGEAAMMVCATGAQAQIGQVAKAVAARREQSAFERGTRQFGVLIVRITSALVVFVVLVNLLAHKPLLESFLFALALAVGLTPELLPMIVTVTLTRGALRLAQRHVVVKRLAALQDLGAIDVLCTDKTGTLTEGTIELIRHLDLHGRDSAAVFRYAWLNCFFESGLRTPMEDAVLAHETDFADGWKKIDEVPFDFERRRVSVLLAQGEAEGERRCLILKGAPADVLAHCNRVCDTPDAAAPAMIALDEAARMLARAQLQALETAGFRTLAVAIKDMPPSRDHARLDDEAGLVLMGFLAFLDPPKASAADALRLLGGLGVKVKVVTGDSDLVTQYIWTALGMAAQSVATGEQIAAMDDAALRACVESVDLFCRVNPLQKSRVILALRSNGHTLGYLGDGINDAPALHNADVGISVEGAADVAREAADLILLRPDLRVLANGVVEGRRTFGNVRKYLMMGASSNFGNMFSMAGAALFLPFLPMLPVQVLLNNILYDLSELTIPLDRVDQAEMIAPQHWDMHFLRNFMFTMGPVSSLFDFLTFFLLLTVLHAGASSFQTGWFVESLASQVLVIFVIRTRFNPFTSRPHPALVLTSLAVVAIAVLLPLLPVGRYWGLVPLPGWFYGALAGLVLAYLVIVQLVKLAFYARVARAPARAI
jgi:Mg2+-importing ATPase